MTILTIIVIIIISTVVIFYLFLNNQFKKEKKHELEQNQLKKQQVELERIRKWQIEEAQKQNELKEKQELEKKRLKEQQTELKRKRNIEKVQKQLELEQKRLNELWEELDRKKLIEDAQKKKLIIENEQKNKRQFQNKFIIYCNEYLKKDTTAYYHSDYNSGGNWKVDGTIENMIWTIKNDASPFPFRLTNAKQKLNEILSTDLPEILNSTNLNNITVCVVPRAKKNSHYRNDQLYFRQIISDVVNKLNGFYNGTFYITRHTNTKTTHLRGEEGGDGRLPYIGITKNTCTISNEVKNKDILLIDDIYTKSVNIDEDAIQALLDNGAKSVIFYSIGKTVSRY